jgi:chemotaxis protein MotB
MRSTAVMRRPRRAEGEGGNYFASMTDLMLGLLFIFIIMLMAFALNMRDAEHKMSDAAADSAEAQQKMSQAASELAEAQRKLNEATNALTESDLARREMLRQLAQMLQGQVPVIVDEENGTLQLGDDVLFPKGSADTYPEALPKLRLLGKALDAVLPCYSLAAAASPPGYCTATSHGRLEAVYIEGHTDATPIKTSRFQSNWDLSAARASETFKKLVEAFPALGGLENDRKERLIGVSGYGELRPVDDSGTPEAMQKNRRIELRFIMVSPQTPELDGLMQQIRSGQNRSNQTRSDQTNSGKPK